MAVSGAGTVQAKYHLPPDLRAYAVQAAQQYGLSASELVDMVLRLWRQVEAGQIEMRPVQPNGDLPIKWHEMDWARLARPPAKKAG